MPTVGELSDPYGNFMLNPEAAAPGICHVCSTFTPAQYPLCPGCNATPQIADAVLPISYEVEGEQLHRALRGYKQLTGTPAERFRLDLAAVLWRFLAIEKHESCLARAADTDGFAMVTTVPSGSRERDERHPLPGIVGYSVEPTKDRYARLLERTPVEVEPHVFSREKYAPIRELSGESVLLLDDTWTRGASMQSAAATLKAAGAGAVGAMVIGRYVRRDFDDHAARVDAIRAPFDWTTCWHHND